MEKTVKELEKRIINLEKLCETFADFHGIDPKRICCFKEKELLSHDFKVGDRVMVLDHVGKEHLGKIISINDFREPSMKYAIDLDDYKADLVFVGESQVRPASDEPKFKVGDKVVVYKGKKVGIVEFVPTIHDDLYKVGFMDGDCDFFAEEDMTPYTEPRWAFTDDEKVILRNLPEGYKWIARDKDELLYVFFTKPIKKDASVWYCEGKRDWYLLEFNHLFQSIKWEDDEACEFRKYI